jgi:predicted RNA-binding Zn-ribbon protein involved in translation (DUF1610 family)
VKCFHGGAEMNPGNATEDLIGLIGFALVIVFIAYKATKSHFVCPECGSSFKVNIGVFIFSGSKYTSKRTVKCPNCGYFAPMEPYDGK